MTDHPAGSSTAGEPVFFEAGLICHPHGVKGEMLIQLNRQYLRSLLPGKQIFLGSSHKPYTLLSCRDHNKGLLIQLEGIQNPEIAGQFRNFPIFISAHKRTELPAGEYYSDQLIGLKVIHKDGQELGRLVEIIETGANDVYVVIGNDKKEILLPAIPEVILNVDLATSLIKVHILPGLIEET